VSRPQELRVKGSYLHHKEIKAAQGVKIAAQNLESAVAGTQMLVANPGDDIELLKEEVMADMADIFSSVDRSGARYSGRPSNSVPRARGMSACLHAQERLRVGCAWFGLLRSPTLGP
jgi:hypothetical protein